MVMLVEFKKDSLSRDDVAQVLLEIMCESSAPKVTLAS